MSKADRRNPYDRKMGKKPRFRFFGSKKRPPATLNFGQLKERGVQLAPHEDVDRDGVRNAADCRPLDPKKHVECSWCDETAQWTGDPTSQHPTEYACPEHVGFIHAYRRKEIY